MYGLVPLPIWLNVLFRLLSLLVLKGEALAWRIFWDLMALLVFIIELAFSWEIFEGKDCFL